MPPGGMMPPGGRRNFGEGRRDELELVGRLLIRAGGKEDPADEKV
jgi:hypothetical protein